MGWIGYLAATALAALIAVVLWLRHAVRWGATEQEFFGPAPGDAWIDGLPGLHFRMTRAVSIEAPPAAVWSWLAQAGRGAGWYSHDRLDNGGRASARHLVTWIPEPRVGDAASIGYLRHLEPGRCLVWWAPDLRFLGARTWSSWAYWIRPEEDGSRLVMRASIRAAGATRFLVAALFPAIDSIMAIRQLRTLKGRVERHGLREDEPDNPESGVRDQYQLHEVVYASGGEAGVPGVEGARRSRKAAEAADLV